MLYVVAGRVFNGGELYRSLAAVHWDALDFTNPGQDFECFRLGVLEGNGPALEVGCGTGRILLPLLAQGFVVHGVDISEDMLACCRRRAAGLGLTPSLYCQPMQRLSLEIRYATIYVPCGTFVLIVDKGEALETLRQFRKCLRPGGSVLFNLLPPSLDDASAPLSDDPPWKSHGDHCLTNANGGDRIVVHRRVISVDPVACLLTEQRRYRVYSGRSLVREEIHVGQETWYSSAEIRDMLSGAGFGRVRITGDYTGEAFSNPSQVMVVQAWT